MRIRFFFKMFIVLMLAFISVSSFASANIPNTGTGIDITSGDVFKSFVDATAYKDVTTTKTLPQLVGDIVKGLLSLLGVVFAIFLIYGGILWMTAGGEQSRLERAKSIIKNSVIGIIITFGAYAISYFVIDIVLKASTNS